MFKFNVDHQSPIEGRYEYRLRSPLIQIKILTDSECFSCSPIEQRSITSHLEVAENGISKAKDPTVLACYHQQTDHTKLFENSIYIPRYVTIEPILLCLCIVAYQCDQPLPCQRGVSSLPLQHLRHKYAISLSMMLNLTT